MSYDMVEEDVPPFQTRVGDYAVHGSNNSSLILGRDRAKNGPATVDDGLGSIDDGGKGKGTGVAHLVAGRQDKNGDPDFKKDNAFVYLAMKTKLDDNLDINTSGDVKQSKDNDVPAAVMKSDNIRIMFRKNAMLVSEDSKNFMFMDGKVGIISIQDGKSWAKFEDKKVTINVGSKTIITMDGDGKKLTVKSTDKVVIDAKECHLTGGCEQPWDDLFKALIDFDEKHNHPTGVGPSGPGLSGPASGSPDASLQAKKSTWDQKVK